MQCSTVPALVRQRAQASPADPAHWTLDAQGVWRSTTWAAFARDAAVVAAGLVNLGLRPGDRVGILAPTSRSWDVAQMAILGARAVVVGLDPFERDEQLSDIARQAGISALIVRSADWVGRLSADARSKLTFVVVLEGGRGAANVERTALFAELLSGPEPLQWDGSSPDDAATIVFTSGSTGNPKGVLYTHRQICAAIEAILDAFPGIGPGSRLVCWLPLANLFQRMINFCAVGRRAQTYYVDDPREVMRHVPRIAPHIFIAVPRFYEKLYGGIRERVARSPAILRRLIDAALASGRAQAAARREGRSLPLPARLGHALADRLVLTRIRSAMGGELRYFISGSAPMPKWLLEEFAALGWPVLEAYGVSENVVPVAANRPADWKLGTVGKPMPGNEVKIAPDGEVLVRGAGVFAGYLGAAADRSSVDADGFLATGDLGEIDADGFITLVGRKSDLFKTSTGRRVAPVPIEQALCRVPYVEHAAVLGAGRRAPVAIVSLSAAGLPAPAEEAAARRLPRAWRAIRADLAAATAALPGYQQPAGFVLTTRPFAPQSGELTSNLKLRRAAIEGLYAAELAVLLDHLDRASGDAGTILREGEDVMIATA